MARIARRVLAVFAFGAMLTCMGCWSNNTYLLNRLSDLTDVAHVDAEEGTFGLLVNVGPLMLGTAASWPDAGGWEYRVGLGGMQEVHLAPTEAYGAIWPLARYSVSRRRYAKLDSGWVHEGDEYWRTEPGWGSAGMSASFFYGLGARVDVAEFADFVLGFFGFDILNDDMPLEQQPDPREAAAEAKSKAKAAE